MAFNIVYKQSVHRDLKKLPIQEASRILDEVERELAEQADTYPMLKGPFAGLRKYRVGDYRVIYAVIENNVLILRIGHRRDVYKKGSLDGPTDPGNRHAIIRSLKTPPDAPKPKNEWSALGPGQPEAEFFIKKQER